MKYFMCKGELENKLTNFMLDLGACIITIKNVPSQVCTQCGEVSYSDEVAHNLEKIVNSTRQSAAEIAILNYENQIAA